MHEGLLVMAPFPSPTARGWNPSPSISPPRKYSNINLLKCFITVVQSPSTFPCSWGFIYILIYLFLSLQQQASRDYIIYKDIGVVHLDNGVKEKALLECAEPHRSPLARNKCQKARRQPLTPLVILSPKARACALKESQKEGNGNKIAGKGIEKAAGSSGYDLCGIPPGRGAESPYCDSPMVQQLPQQGVGSSTFGSCTASPSVSPGLFSRTDRTLLREARKKKGRKKKGEHTRTEPGRNGDEGEKSVPWQRPRAAGKSLPALFIDDFFFFLASKANAGKLPPF